MYQCVFSRRALTVNSTLPREACSSDAKDTTVLNTASALPLDSGDSSAHEFLVHDVGFERLQRALLSDIKLDDESL